MDISRLALFLHLLTYCIMLCTFALIVFSRQTEIATIERVVVHMVFPIEVMLADILADGHLLEALDHFEILNFEVERHVLIARLLQRVFGVIDVEPLLYPCVHSQELDEYLVALHVVDDIHVEHSTVDELRNEWRKTESHVEACRL